jgi:hypothetical protein
MSDGKVKPTEEFTDDQLEELSDEDLRELSDEEVADRLALQREEAKLLADPYGDGGKVLTNEVIDDIFELDTCQRQLKKTRKCSNCDYPNDREADYCAECGLGIKH